MREMYMRNNCAGFFVIGLLCIYGAVEFLFVGKVPAQKVIYALIMLSMLLHLVNPSIRRITLLWISILCPLLVVWAFLGLQQPVFLYKWYLADIFVVIYLFLFLLASTNGSVIFKEARVQLVAYALLCAVIVGALVTERVNARVDAPPLFIIAFFLYYALSSSYKSLLFAVASLLVFWLGYNSGQRSFMLLFGVAFVVLLYMKYGWKVLGLLLGAAALLLLFAPIGLAEKTGRFALLFSSGGFQFDASLLMRVYEVRDAMSYFYSHAEVTNWLFGMGAGAVYLSELSDKSFNPNILNGYSHFIHVTPAFMMFRYGLVGVLLFVWVFWVVIYAVVCRRVQGYSTIFYVSSFLYCLDSLMRNIMVDPFFVYSISGGLYYEQRRRSLINA